MTMPTLQESVAREISKLKSDAVKVSALAIAALKIAEEIDGGPDGDRVPSHRDSVALYRELRLTMDALTGGAASADELSPTDAAVARRQAEQDELSKRRRARGGAS